MIGQNQFSLYPFLKVKSTSLTESHQEMKVEITKSNSYEFTCIGGGGASLGGWNSKNCNKNGASGGGAGGVSQTFMSLTCGQQILLKIGRGGQEDFNKGYGNDTCVVWFDRNQGGLTTSEIGFGGQQGSPYDSFETKFGHGGKGNLRNGQRGNSQKTYQSYFADNKEGPQLYEIEGAGGGSFYNKRARGGWNGAGEEGCFPGGGAGGGTEPNGLKGGDGHVIIKVNKMDMFKAGMFTF